MTTPSTKSFGGEKPKGMRRHWNELVGYIIQPRRNIPIIVILLGSGDNGKTVLIRTVIRIARRSSCSVPSEWTNSTRVVSQWVAFSASSYSSTTTFEAGARLPDGTLKIISEAKEVTGEQKYGPPFNFIVRTIPVLLCNNIPSLG